MRIHSIHIQRTHTHTHTQTLTYTRIHTCTHTHTPAGHKACHQQEVVCVELVTVGTRLAFFLRWYKQAVQSHHNNKHLNVKSAYACAQRPGLPRACNPSLHASPSLVRCSYPLQAVLVAAPVLSTHACFDATWSKRPVLGSTLINTKLELLR